jgi:hypothetical protein
VVIISFPSTYSISASGMTFSTATVGGNKVVTFTAGDGTAVIS